MFAFWDWMAGTLYVPRGREEFPMGLQNGEHEEYHSVARLYFLPVRKAYNVLRTGVFSPGGRFSQNDDNHLP
jgi:hypothetical protein